MIQTHKVPLAEKDIKINDDRIIGSISGNNDGPEIIILAGMHGNEQSGVEAVKELFDILNDSDAHFHGSLLALRANTKALKQNCRYIDEDMNRIWFPAIIDEIRRTPQNQLSSSERVEMKQLLTILDAVDQPRNNAAILADVHTFSADGCLFSITNKDPKQTSLLSQIHVPMIFGIEKTLRGTALSYYQDRGFISFGLEGGQHEHKLTKYHTMASLVMLLTASGFVSADRIPEIAQYRRDLKKRTKQKPLQSELIYQHIIEYGDQFKMQPGYKNFQAVEKGEWLAEDKDGRILAQSDGFILMPLYQRQGNDGFFIVKEYDG